MNTTKKISLILLLTIFTFGGCSEPEVDTKPVGAFSVSESSTIPGATITFTDLSFDQNGKIVAWEWDFGDGQKSTEPSPQHSYKLSGEYTAKLTVTDNSGNKNVNDFSKIISASTTNVAPKILWQYTLPNIVVNSSPAVSEDGVVYIGCANIKTGDNVFAIKDGKLQWSYPAKDEIRSSPAISSSGNIYIGSYDDRLYNFSKEGTVVWSYNLKGNPKYSGPVFGHEGQIYIGTQSKEIIAVNADGTDLWRYKPTTNKDVNGTAVVGVHGNIYIGSTDGYFYALTKEGKLKWKQKYGKWTATATAMGADGTIYFAGEGNVGDPSKGGVLIAYDSANGNEKWRADLTAKVNNGGPSIGKDGTVYVGTNSKEILAFSVSGNQLWSYATQGNVISVPAIDNDGNIYVGDDVGYFYVVDAQGKKKWKELSLGTKIWNSAAIGKDGTIYVAADQVDGTAILYALKTEATGLADSPWPMLSRTAQHTGN